MNDGASQQAQTTPGVGAVLGGRFRVLRRIGEGGMGVVLEAENTLTGKRVAIKWMHPQMASQAEAAERMVREARASARVRHPNVVDVYDVVQESGAIFLVMELLEGEPLSSLLERGSAKPHEIISHMIDAMRGVSAAHREGVIHRDIKPDNIFLARESDRSIAIPKVLDFGISKLTDREGGLSLTRTGMTLGTPLYMSYEQLAGVRDIDGRTDVYAFGVILYEALTGQPPFDAETFSELIIKITTTQPATPKSLQPSVPGALSSIVETAMRRERAERTPSLDALISQLEPYATAEGYSSRLTAAGDSPIGLAPTMATPISLPISVPSPERGKTGPLTISDPGDVRISSIPRSFTARGALIWGGVALAIAAAIAWLATQPASEKPAADSKPLAVTPNAETPLAEPASPSASPTPSVPEPQAIAEEPSPAVVAPITPEPAKPKPEQPTAAPAKKPREPRPNATLPAAQTKPVFGKPAKPAAEEKPKSPGTTPRAGRPQSTEF
jgi:serine/threonine protein kinase